MGGVTIDIELKLNPFIPNTPFLYPLNHVVEELLEIREERLGSTLVRTQIIMHEEVKTTRKKTEK